MPTAAKQQKIDRLRGTIQIQPVPEWPPLPAFIAKTPEQAAALEAWRQQVIEFFKKAGTIANV
jgi:hypothetical protein